MIDGRVREDETTLVSFVVELQNFLAARGYPISQDFASRFFGFAQASLHICDHDLLFYEPVFETLAVSSKAHHETFHDDYTEFVRNRRVAVVSDEKAEQLKWRSQARKQAQDDIFENSKRASNLKARLEKLEKERNADLKQIGTQKLSSDIEKLTKELSQQFDSVFSECPHKSIFKDLPDIARRKKPLPSDNELSEMRDELKSAAKRAIKGKNAMQMMKLISAMEDLLRKISNHKARSGESVIRKVKNDLASAQKAADEASERFDKIVQKMNDDIFEISKRSSQTSRELFTAPKNAVKSDFAGRPELLHSFDSLSQAEKDAIRDYIRENARKFKTRMSRNIRTSAKNHIDIATTCKKACGTMGVPIRLEYTKPTRNKAKLLMFLDVSGSCKEASEMMLSFMHAMREVFPGGSRTYAFVNSLYDISAIFDSVDADQAISTVLSQIPTRGIYSDYHRPFSNYTSEHLNEVDGNTLVFFIGDARNNRNPTSEEDIKAIARKAKRAYWLNTEDAREWDKADSIMGIYSQYMNKVVQVTTPGELIGFLTELH